MKRTLFVLILSIAILLHSFSVAEYSYSFSDSIPHSAQDSAVQYMLNTVASMTDKDKPYSYTELLDIYLKFYGIFTPESTKNNESVIWVQETLLADTDRITIIPDRYVRSDDLTDWVNRYAEPGDLLLYKQNGKADKCIVFAGNGKMIGRSYNGNDVIDIRATFAAGENMRTKSAGLFAIAHIWADKTVPDGVYADLQLVLDPDARTFTQKHYTIAELNPLNKKYEDTGSFVLVEYKPGIYRVWNGDQYGFSEEYISAHNGIHLQLSSDHIAVNQITKQIKIDLELPDIIHNASESHAVLLNIASEAVNAFQWTGHDMINATEAGYGNE